MQLSALPRRRARICFIAPLLLIALAFASKGWAKENNIQAGYDTRIQAVVTEAYQAYKDDDSGKNADYIKALAEVDPSIFGITLVTADGKIYEAGDASTVVAIESISKIFTVALVMREKGEVFVLEKIGADATGLKFNSIIAIEEHNGSAGNPLVNAGAIQAASWVDAEDSETRWHKIKTNMDDFAGHTLSFNETVYHSEVTTNKRNRAIAQLLDAYNRMGSDPLEATDIYTKQCSVNVSSHDLAVMGATLANNGINPITAKQVLENLHVPRILAIMATAGLYDNTGDWYFSTGTPAKSGVGGGILAVIPGTLAIGIVSPPLDPYGNSVRGQKAASYIIDRLGLNPLAR